MSICKSGNLLNTKGETSDESSVPVKKVNLFWVCLFLWKQIFFMYTAHFVYGMLNVERTIRG